MLQHLSSSRTFIKTYLEAIYCCNGGGGSRRGGAAWHCIGEPLLDKGNLGSEEADYTYSVKTDHVDMKPCVLSFESLHIFLLDCSCVE